MIKSSYPSFSTAARLVLMAVLVIALTLGSAQGTHAAVARLPVELGAATHFSILTKTGITNVPTSAITGDLGVSPAAATYITGFSLVADSTNVFSRSSQVTGKIYAANYSVTTPANMTTAINNMQTAYADAAGRSIPDFTELFAGNLSGKTLVPGLYKWGTDVLITTNVILAGSANAVWIFQVAGNLTMGSGAKMLLSGGAQARNIFWQVAGGVGIEIGATAHVEGTLLAAKAIHLRTGASLNGRALSQTAVTLAKNKVVIPAAGASRTNVFTSNPVLDGWVLESGENSNVGGTMNSTTTTLNVGDNAANKQYRAILHFDTSSLPDTAVITKVTLKIMKQGLIGTNPFTTHRSLLADIRKPFFGASAALQVGDFQTTASRGSVAVFGAAPAGDWYSAVLSSAGNAFVNRTGATQFRLHFALDDNNNHAADYMKFYSGNASMVACHPQLIVTYYMP